MHAYRVYHAAARGLLWLGLAILQMLPCECAQASEDVFPVLQVGAETYTNVTVTTKAKNYIFILHANGMTSIKVSQLPEDLREKLGYAIPTVRKPATNNAALWAKRELSKLSVPRVKELTAQVAQKWRGESTARLSAAGLVGPKLLIAALGILLLIYLFHCYCCMLICQKTGNPPGFLIWLPVVQLLPLLRAAGMSSWWFLAYFVPGLNLVPLLVWPFAIAEARGKSGWVGVLLLLPVANLFAFLYLAFSGRIPDNMDDEPEPKVMTLQAA
jgi:hypothetical protein